MQHNCVVIKLRNINCSVYNRCFSSSGKVPGFDELMVVFQGIKIFIDSYYKNIFTPFFEVNFIDVKSSLLEILISDWIYMQEYCLPIWVTLLMFLFYYYVSIWYYCGQIHYSLNSVSDVLQFKYIDSELCMI